MKKKFFKGYFSSSVMVLVGSKNRFVILHFLLIADGRSCSSAIQLSHR